jgi:hypothetical protein
MKLSRLLPIISLAALPLAQAMAQDTTKPTTPVPPPTTESPSYQTPAVQNDWYQQRMNALLKGITLTSQQRAKLDSIQMKYKDQLPPMPNPTVKPNDPANPTQRPDSAQQSMLLMILERQDGEVRAALKSDQQKIWDKNKKDWQQSHTPIG